LEIHEDAGGGQSKVGGAGVPLQRLADVLEGFGLMPEHSMGAGAKKVEGGLRGVEAQGFGEIGDGLAVEALVEFIDPALDVGVFFRHGRVYW
jgi:hypothetical protein